MMNLEAIYEKNGTPLTTVKELRSFLAHNRIDPDAADEGKGLQTLLDQINSKPLQGKLVQHDKRIYRVAQVLCVDVYVQDRITPSKYWPVLEVGRFHLKKPVTQEQIKLGRFDDLWSLDILEVEKAEPRPYPELWETGYFGEGEDEAISRFASEELLLADSQIRELHTRKHKPAQIKFENPGDWAGIPSVNREIYWEVKIPSHLSRELFIEVENGLKLTVFAAGPYARTLQGLLGTFDKVIK